MLKMRQAKVIYIRLLSISDPSLSLKDREDNNKMLLDCFILCLVKDCTEAISVQGYKGRQTIQHTITP